MPFDWRQLQIKNRGQAIAIGIGVVALAPIVLPVVAKAGKAIAKTTIKTSFELYEKSKDTAAEAVEVWQDLVAEVQAELATEKQVDSSDRTNNS
ncbi:MAG: DUF5132 domain-containing protein [Phormidium sp.]